MSRPPLSREQGVTVGEGEAAQGGRWVGQQQHGERLAEEAAHLDQMGREDKVIMQWHYHNDLSGVRQDCKNEGVFPRIR